MNLKRTLVACIACMVLLGTVFMCGPAEAAAKDTLIYVMGTEIVSLDPPNQTDTPSMTVIRHIYDLPIHPTPDGKLAPGLFTSWEHSADGKTWTFHLRKGVKFHDGTPFNAEAVKFVLERNTSATKKVIRRSFFTPWAQTIKVIDDYTIQTSSDKPFAPILRFLTHASAAMVSPAALQKYGNQINRNAVGTGPFRFVEWLPGDRIVLERNEDFWGEKPKYKTLIFRFVKESSVRAMMLETGEADLALKISPVDIDRLRKVRDVDVLVEPANRAIGLTINTTAPLLNDVRFRRALAYAIDKDSIITHIMKGVARPSCSTIGGGTFGEVTPKCYEFNPEKAKQLLKEVGYNGEKITIWTPQGRYTMDRETAETVQAFWSQVGVNAETRVMDFASIVKGTQLPPDKVKYQVVFIGFGPVSGDGDQVLRARYASSQIPPNGANLSRYSNPEYDSYAEAQAVELDVEKRLEMMKKCQEIVMQDLPVIPLYTIDAVVGVRKNVKGVEMLPIEMALVREAYLEK